MRGASGTGVRELGLAAILLATSACVHPRAGAGQDPWIQADEIQYRLVLVGDAGDAERGRALLERVGEVVDRMPRRTTLVYLGDNFYDRGAVVVDATGTSPALQRQLDAGTHRSKTLFIPGNHDWDDGGVLGVDLARGYTRLSAMERYVAANRGEPGRWLPRAGCPGPASVDLGAVKLVAIDSQWWLLDPEGRRALSDNLGCDAKTEAEVTAALDRELACSGTCPPRILLAHHPLRSHGSHGGYFPWREHLVCADWVPLPLFCSAYVLARRAGVTRQDLASQAYRNYASRLGEVIDRHPPLAFVAGHEHNLQVLRDGGQLHLVSGSGSKRTAVEAGPDFRSSELGFMTIDFASASGVLLSVYEYAGQPELRRPSHQEWILPPGAR